MPEKYKSSDEWDEYVRSQCPILDNLWQQGRCHEYETLKQLSGLDYSTYWDNVFASYAEYLNILAANITNIPRSYLDLTKIDSD